MTSIALSVSILLNILLVGFLYFVYLKVRGEAYDKQSVHIEVGNTTLSVTKPNYPYLTKERIRTLPRFGQYEKNQYDYDSIEYPVPFNQLYKNLGTHYIDFGLKTTMPSFVLTGYIPEFGNHQSDSLFITGASDNHGLGSFNCLFSIVLHMPFSNLAYIDYELSNELVDKLSSHFETIHGIHQKLKSTAFLAYRKYNWDNLPDWMLLFNHTEQRGGYSWKIVAYLDLVFEWKAMTGWLDGGNIVIDGLSREMMAVKMYGLYSPTSAGNIGKWVHNDTKEFMMKHRMIDSYDDLKSMASGNNIYVDYRNEFIRNNFLIPFKECCYTQKCITPTDSNMRNHRQDQAVLSIFISSLKLNRSADGKYQYIPALRNERGNKEWATKPLLLNVMKNIENVYNIRLSNRYYNASEAKYSHQEYKFTTRTQDPEWP